MTENKEQEKNINEILERQISNSVYFEDTLRYLIDNGVDTFVEIGPGKTLAGFNKKIGKQIGKELITYNVATMEDIDKLVEALA